MVCVSLFRKFCVGETKFSIPQSADADERDDVGIVPYNTKGNLIREVPFAIKFIQAQMRLCITDNTYLFRQSAFDVFRVLLFFLFQEP